MRVSRGSITDAVTRDGETVVMVGDQVMLLSPLASAALARIDGDTDVAVVGAALVEMFGAPPDGDPISMTLSVLQDLSAAGVVKLDG